MSRQDWEYRREIVLPFSLELADAPTLVCEEILRLLPGRRLVCRAVQEGQPVLVKLFMGKDARRAAREDAAGIRAMMVADIDTPSLRLESRIKSKGYPVLLFDFIPAAVSFCQRWTEAGEARRVELLQALLGLVAQQHQAGLCQRDLHLNNFILDADDHLYAIDGGDFIVGNQPLAQKEAIVNLGVLFGHLPLQALRKHPQALESYFNRRGQEASEGLIRRISLKSDAFRHRRARRISRKSFRNCSEFMLRRNGELRICQRRDFSPVELDGRISSTGLAPRVEETILKPGNSQTVWVTSMGGRDVVVKRYNLKNPWHALRRVFTRSRASRSWENAHRLRAYHIPTPEPLAMIEERRFGLRQRAWLITAKARGIGAKSYIPDHSDEPTLERLVSVVRAFGENGLVHGDMKATNFMLADESIEVIDLDSMFRPLTGPVLRARVTKDRRRFLKNWQDAGLRERFARLLGQGFG